MKDVSKRVKRLLRTAAGAAHEEELGRALLPVAEAFELWKAGQLGSGELSEILHRFHQGPNLELFRRYNAPNPNLAVAHAIVTGILDRSTIAPELLEHLAGALKFYESQAAPRETLGEAR
jgi:hypothetical protein